jgi:hypothetical protein
MSSVVGRVVSEEVRSQENIEGSSLALGPFLSWTYCLGATCLPPMNCRPLAPSSE